MRKIIERLAALAAGAALAWAFAAHAATFNLFQPANGILVGNPNTYVTTAATSSNVRSLWTGTCDGTTFLRGDGACAAAGGASFPLLAPDGSDTNPSYSFSTSPAAGMWLDGADNLRITVDEASGASRLELGPLDAVLASGPAGTLSVAGDTQIVLDAAGGTNELVLQALLATFGGRVVTVASSAADAGLNLPHGAAPSTPVNGDMWTTTAGLFARINGSTIGPYTAVAGGSPGGSDGQIQYNNGGAFGGTGNLLFNDATSQWLFAAPDTTFELVGVAAGVDEVGGSFSLAGGLGDGTGNGGDVLITSGGGGDDTGAGGVVSIGGADGGTSGGNGGNVDIYGGFGQTNADGGSIFLTAGQGAGSGVNGQIVFDGQIVNGAGVDMTAEQGQFTATFDNGCTTSPTIDFDYYKIGNSVTLGVNGSTGWPCTSDSTALATTGTPVPSQIRPANTTGSGVGYASYVGRSSTDNGTAGEWQMLITSGGDMQFSFCPFAAVCTTWTASGSKTVALDRDTFPYILGDQDP